MKLKGSLNTYYQNINFTYNYYPTKKRRKTSSFPFQSSSPYPLFHSLPNPIQSRPSPPPFPFYIFSDEWYNCDVGVDTFIFISCEAGTTRCSRVQCS